MRLCKSWAEEYRPSAFVILINFSNLAVRKQKLRPSERQKFYFPTFAKPWPLAARQNNLTV